MSSTIRRWWLPVAVLVLLIVSLGLYQVQRDQRSQVLDGTDGVESAQHVVVAVTVRGVDPAKDQMQLHIEVEPAEGLLDVDGRLREPLTIDALELTVPVIEFAAGTVPKGTEAFVDTLQGIDTDYPLDTYRSMFGFRAQTGESDEKRPVDVALVGFASSPGFLVDMAASEVDGDTGLVVDAQRSLTTRLVAILIMVILWALAISVARIARLIASGARPFEFASLTWMGAMIFAMFALRNAAPGSPPFGSLLDFAAFLPAEVIVTASLVACAWRYVHPVARPETGPGA